MTAAVDELGAVVLFVEDLGRSRAFYHEGRGLAVEFEDDAMYSDLAERGIAFFQEPTDQPWGMRTAYFKDPDGHVWEIAQPVQRSES